MRSVARGSCGLFENLRRDSDWDFGKSNQNHPKKIKIKEKRDKEKDFKWKRQNKPEWVRLILRYWEKWMEVMNGTSINVLQLYSTFFTQYSHFYWSGMLCVRSDYTYCIGLVVFLWPIVFCESLSSPARLGEIFHSTANCLLIVFFFPLLFLRANTSGDRAFANM